MGGRSQITPTTRRNRRCKISRISKSTYSSRIVPSVIQGTAVAAGAKNKSSSYPSFKLSRVFKQVQTCRFLHFVATFFLEVSSKEQHLEHSNYITGYFYYKM